MMAISWVCSFCRGISVGCTVYRAYGRVVEIADVMIAALLLGLRGSVLSLANRCVNLVIRLVIS